MKTTGQAAGFLLLFTLVCGFIYTGIITAGAQAFFPHQANGSMIEVEGENYGSALVGQPFAQPNHLWGRPTNLDVTTYQDEQGTPLLYAAPSNLRPASEAYSQLIAQRVMEMQKANPEQGDAPVPVELVTGSGSGLDPHISMAAAQYQVPRLARENNLSQEQVQQIIDSCTKGKFLGVLGQETVNVLQVNLMLDGILE